VASLARAFRLGARRAHDLEPDRDIVDRGLPWKQRIGLKEITGIPLKGPKVAGRKF
jgi:hypothetical protein